MRAFSASLLLLSVYLFAINTASARDAGPGVGGGGGVVLCLNPDQSVKSVELVDLVESKFYDHTSPSPQLAALPWEEQVKATMNRIAFVDPEFYSMLVDRVNFVYTHLDGSLKDTSGTELIFPAPQDLSHGRVPPINLGCQVAGAAVFNDSATDNNLTISSFLWNHLSEMNKAALVLHEAIYYTHRNIYANLGRDTTPDSSATRALVGFLFSEELEQNSPTASERARFAAAGPFRSYDLGSAVSVPGVFRSRVREFAGPLLPYNLKGAERPLFLDTLACNGGFDLVITDPVLFQASPAHSCTATAVAHLWPLRVDVRTLSPASRNASAHTLDFKYEPHKDNLLEDVRVTCKSRNTLVRFNPGFRLYCGSSLVADIIGSSAADTAGLAVKRKADFAAAFLHDFE
ncbi:MAG: hypothetical protein ACXVCI_11180, partial [Bdellovibrionota bacterium]